MTALKIYSENVATCVACLIGREIRCNGECPCPADPDKRGISDHAKAGYCPESRYDANAERPEKWEKVPASLSPQRNAIFRKMWAELHRRPLAMVDAISERAWIDGDFTSHVRCGPCKNNWLANKVAHPFDLSSPRDYFLSTVFHHNLVNTSIGKPEVSPAKAARIHGMTHLLTAEELAADTSPVKLLVTIDWSLGDEVVATSAIRDLQAAYPGEYEISIRCKSPEVFEGMVSTTPEEKPDLVWRMEVNYEPNRHFIDYARHQLERVTNRHIQAGPMRPHLVLSDEEVAAPPLVDGPYWIAATGFKLDATVKSWPADNWQAVANHFAGKVRFVTVGGVGVEHVEQHIENTVDLIGKTTVRELFRLVADPNCLGVLSSITSLLHIGAAFGKPLVTIAGGRESPWVARYPSGEWLETRPPCAGCWRLRVKKIESAAT